MNGNGTNGGTNGIAVGDNVQTTYDSESSSRVVDLFIKVSSSIAVSYAIQGAAVAYWLERRIRDRNEDCEREFDSPLTHTLSKVRDAQ